MRTQGAPASEEPRGEATLPGAIAMLTWRDLAHPMAGGSEVLVDRVARGLVARGVRVTVICGGPLGTDPRPYELRRSGGTYGQYVATPVVTRRAGPFDVLIDVENGVPYFSPLWWKGPTVCLVHHVHTDQWATRFAWPVAALGRFAERRLMPLAYRRAVFVVPSRSSAQALAAIGVEETAIRVVENGVDPPPASRPSPELAAMLKSLERPLWVVVSRLVPHKQVNLVLEAWRTVGEQVRGTLLVVGDGPERHRLEAMAPHRALLLGRVSEDDKWELLREASLLVHAAHHEGWGMAILEAASVGVPSLALDAPGVRDAVIDGRTGLLAPDIESLARAWVALAGNEARRRRLGEAARRRAGTLRWEDTVEGYLAAAREAIVRAAEPARGTHEPLRLATRTRR
jgi:glycosyltransferase involved in cell wall biosynthesis